MHVVYILSVLCVECLIKCVDTCVYVYVHVCVSGCATCVKELAEARRERQSPGAGVTVSHAALVLGDKLWF